MTTNITEHKKPLGYDLCEKFYEEAGRVDGLPAEQTIYVLRAREAFPDGHFETHTVGTTTNFDIAHTWQESGLIPTERSSDYVPALTPDHYGFVLAPEPELAAA